MQLSTMQNLARYWGTQYDWRRCEARLAALPQFTTTIDGVDIHFIHVRSKEKNALPVIVTHGWPGSIIEQLKIIDPLTNPTAYGGTAADAPASDCTVEAKTGAASPPVERPTSENAPPKPSPAPSLRKQRS
jgi:hypothetical protein